MSQILSDADKRDNMKRMVVDASNVLFRVAAAHGKYSNYGTDEERASMALHVAIQTVNKYFRIYKPDQVALTFEGQKNWRKDFTRSESCLSKRVYKANRVKDSSFDAFFELIRAFEELARNHTSLVCLSNPILEGDDLFAGYVQRFTAIGDEVIGISGDKDFVQLLKHGGFTLINPDTGKPRTVKDTCGVDDPYFFMFEKAMRGDKGDNVFPAYPRVLKTRLHKCLNDEYELTKIMNETWSFTDPDTLEKTEYRVGDLFEENLVLMDLECQPDYVRAAIDETLDRETNTHGKFSFFGFTKFCGKYGLKQIAENAQTYAALFSTTNEEVARSKEMRSLVAY